MAEKDASPSSRSPRLWQHYGPSELIRAAFLAGRGSSAPEIAESLGGGRTARHIYELVRRHGLSLVPKKRNQIAFPLVVSTETMARIESAAEKHGTDPETLAARLLEEMASDGRAFRERVQRVAGERAEAAE
ncbi:MULTISPECIES: hypothetical protein [Methylosinus]|uniref:Uncharacterized protein n=1 Tax=Methylosinus trichosporium (strain ATCC 35070 / NCIMB 11131 / UNIQEM 75 / OB3b) TaxID=595536 RepID=A0A2D2CW65_METT3|nr:MULTISPECIES: hypothetical protein [Methylosinus]ATQ66906.1 hypothetical protein CQW49_02580 [Methylosinus trichosporium OB3b]OBS54132.1 hypothetical protein A8B73_02565 [Methylosinus sp. 3S-1]